MTAGRAHVRLVSAMILVLVARPMWAQTVVVPAGVAFNVTDVTANTAGTPNPVTVSYSNPLLFQSNQKLKISVRADASTFAGPGTTRIAASSVSWTATASAGSAANGTLTNAAYGEVYRSPANLKATTTGSVTLHWTLAPIAATGLRAGTHTLTVRWKLEAF
jgi:hypothetical protein